jgi:hypothetical protein
MSSLTGFFRANDLFSTDMPSLTGLIIRQLSGRVRALHATPNQINRSFPSGVAHNGNHAVVIGNEVKQSGNS